MPVARMDAALSPHTAAALAADPLISGLSAAANHDVEVIAFGVAYTGRLTLIDAERGFAIVDDGTDRVHLEFERIESFRILAP